MDKAVELFGYLVLAFLGFVVPVISFLLSFYQDGISKLKEQYENEKKQIIQKIKDVSKRLDREGDFKPLNAILKELKKNKNKSDKEIRALNPQKQFFKLSLPLLLSFLCILLYFIFLDYKVHSFSLKKAFSLISSLSFGYFLFVFWKLFKLILEIKKKLDQDRIQNDLDYRALLLDVLKKNTIENIHIKIDEEELKSDDQVLMLSSDQKKELKIALINLEDRMAKNVEMGFIFSDDFIIDKSSGYSVTTDSSQQIIRFYIGSIQANTTHIFSSPLLITALKSGQYNIKTFIKGENVKTNYRKLILQIAK